MTDEELEEYVRKRYNEPPAAAKRARADAAHADGDDGGDGGSDAEPAAKQGKQGDGVAVVSLAGGSGDEEMAEAAAPGGHGRDDTESQGSTPPPRSHPERLRAEYGELVAKGYVVHSVHIKTELNANGEEKKKPKWPVPWGGTAPSTFNASCNSLSIDCGRSGLVVIDVDPPALSAWAAIEAETGGRPNTRTVSSGSGGLHLYFKAFEDEQLNRSIAKAFELNGEKLAIDVRGRGGCIFAPPSAYHTLADVRRRYEVINDADVAEMPPALVAKLKSLLRASPLNLGVRGPATDPALRRSARVAAAGGAGGGNGGGPGPGSLAPRTDAFEGVYDQLKKTREAVHIVETLATTPELLDVFDNHDVHVRIAFALNNIANGTDLLLPVYTQLLRASPQAQSNVAEYAAGLYRTPPPADGGPRPGLTYLRGLLPKETTTDEEKEELLELLEPIAEQAHVAQPQLASITAAHRKRLASGLAKLAVGITPRTDFDIALYLAELANSRYRYYKNKMEKEATLVYLGGVVYVKETWEEVASYTQRLTRNVLNSAVALCEENALLTEACTFLKKLLAQMSSASVYDRWMAHACRELKSKLFYEERGMDAPLEFYKKLDANVYITAFKNGVYDFRTRKFYRPGAIPADAIGCYSTGYDYLGDEDGLPLSPEDKAKMEEIEREIIDKVFPNETLRRAAKRALGCALIGGSAVAKKLFVALGSEGDNAKSALINWLIKQVLGEYFFTISVAHATSTRDVADGCEPSMVFALKRKMVVMNEGPKDTPLNAPWVKMMTGGDDVNVRTLWGLPEPQPFLAKLWLLSNHEPTFAGIERVGEKRLYPLSFDAKFEEGLAADDPAAGRWRARPENEMRDYCIRAAPYMALLLIQWCKEFLDAGCKLLPLPADSRAVRDTAAASLSSRLKDFLEDGFTKTREIQDKDDMFADDYISLSALHGLVRDGGIQVTVSELNKTLKGSGYTVRQLNRCVKTAREGGNTTLVRVANAVMVQRKPAPPPAGAAAGPSV